MTTEINPPVVVILGQGALALGRRLIASIPGAMLHALKGRLDPGVAVDDTFSDTGAHLRRLFEAGTPIIAVCASGILIRTLAPVLVDKLHEPPVIAVALDGSAVVPLLGGHHGGNDLARRLAVVLGISAAVTTAGDVSLGLALDEPPPRWRLGHQAAAKTIMAALVDQKPVTLKVEAGDAGWIQDSGVVFAEAAALTIRVTDRAAPMDNRTLILHPPVLALGIGCARGASVEAVTKLAFSTLENHALSPHSVACVVSVDIKADEPAIQALADQLGVPTRFFSAATLEAETPRLATPSEIVFRELGCHGVAEAAALAATGSDGKLIVPKTKSENVTCAVARAAIAIDPDSVGRARGRLYVVGIGPGAVAWRTPEATAAIAAADHLVGYGLYLDLLGAATAGKIRHDSPLGAEEARVRTALDLAGEGKTVALVCSGDPGIYALATLVFECIERNDQPSWRRIAITVVPGISALQAAAARAGAPIGHDFCAISLSDLLTPWPVIEQRLSAAATGDFVIALYNPVSLRRRDQLSRARELLLACRKPETPVILARNLGREGERLSVITLGELTPDHADMLTLVVVGNSETRTMTHGERHWLYTPRGYSGKA